QMVVLSTARFGCGIWLCSGPGAPPWAGWPGWVLAWASPNWPRSVKIWSSPSKASWTYWHLATLTFWSLPVGVAWPLRTMSRAFSLRAACVVARTPGKLSPLWVLSLPLLAVGSAAKAVLVRERSSARLLKMTMSFLTQASTCWAQWSARPSHGRARTVGGGEWRSRCLLTPDRWAGRPDGGTARSPRSAAVCHGHPGRTSRSAGDSGGRIARSAGAWHFRTIAIGRRGAPPRHIRRLGADVCSATI